MDNPVTFATRPRETGDEPVRNRIGNRGEDNGDGSGRLFGGQALGCACGGQHDINLERNQFGRESGEPLGLPLGISVLNHDVATLDVAEVTQALTEGLLQGLSLTNSPLLLGLINLLHWARSCCSRFPAVPSPTAW